jgi:hypothetical protein
MGWKEVSRRAFIGEKIPLKSAGDSGLYIRPRKLSQDAADELGEITRSMFRSGDFEKSKRLRDLIKELDAEGKTLDDADQLELLYLMPPAAGGNRAKMFEICLLHGIGEHNLTDDSGKVIGEGRLLDPRTVKELIEEAAPLAAEMFAAIQAFNRPLDEGSGRTSSTSPNGSTRDPSTSQTPSSPTDAGLSS